MKKTLLATAIIGALGASAAAQAATVYDQDGTKLDVYGRIAMGIAGGGAEYNDDKEKIDNSAEFVDVYSRLGLRMSQEVNSDLTAFGRVEWRFKGDERYTESGFTEVRQSYLGLQSKQYGTVQAGNFDSFYNQFVSLPFDWEIDRGLEFAGHTKQSRGDSIGYYTPDLEGWTAFLQLKYYSERGRLENVPGGADGVRDDGNVVAAQGGVRYEQGPVTVGLGFVDDVVRGGGNGKLMGGLIGSYQINDQLTARLGYEGRKNSDTRGGGYDTWGLGGTYTTGPWAFAADVYNVDPDGDDDSRTAWALGSYYKVSSNFDVFLELNQRDQQSVDVTIGGGDGVRVDRADGDDIYYLTGARYHF
ncbi:porin [Vreelandella alkaliphila]|uniref:Porin n=1 Tax=Vreelandella alkaliphila TaxID=272774 RepID=A0ABX4HE07_9GAMM|nr:porin [Halomonas humidisoli]PAU70553.1 porin [Halomonas humidisoli]